jgi:DNA alkylation damage repair protein AlkB
VAARCATHVHQPAADWTNRVYREGTKGRPLPLCLRGLALHFARLAAQASPGTSYSSAAPYAPDAAIVNYYHEGDTLSGHKDDVERDLCQPIVSLSLGVDAVFLLGGRTRDHEPLALLLRSGDVLVMSAASRVCFHGARHNLYPTSGRCALSGAVTIIVFSPCTSKALAQLGAHQTHSTSQPRATCMFCQKTGRPLSTCPTVLACRVFMRLMLFLSSGWMLTRPD